MIVSNAASLFDDPAAANAPLAEAFARQTGFRRTRALPCEHADAASIVRRIHSGKQNEPVLLRGLAADWPALKRWDREYLLSRWGDVQVGALVGLPAHGVPFLTPEIEMRREMTLRAFWNQMETDGRCYVEQRPLATFPGLEADVRIGDLMSTRPRRELNLWLGRGTKSGLHFDSTENLFAMIRGHKFVALASADETARLYPFLGSIMKSRVDVERPDFVRFPRAAGVAIQVGRLAPGDVLYIPVGWWHHLASPTGEHHISVNCSFGRELSLPALASRLLRLGPRHVGRLLRDFLVYGLLGRPCAGRVHTLPNGLQLYRKLRVPRRRGTDSHPGGEGATLRR